MAESISLRPHHGLCIHHFVGKGYSEAFVENMERVIDLLGANPDMPIALTATIDDVLCGHCPHNTGGACESGQKPVDYDNRALELTGFSDGEHTTWRAFSALVRERILEAGLLGAVCEGCQWLELCMSVDC